ISIGFLVSFRSPASASRSRESRLTFRLFLRVRCCCSSGWMMSSQYAPKETASTAIKTIAGRGIRISGLRHNLHVLEHIHRQLDARRHKAVAALRTNAGRAEAASHLAPAGDPALLEQENVLHGDHFAFDPRDLGDGR